MPCQKFIRPAIATSLVMHIAGLGVLAAWSNQKLNPSVHFTGDKQAIRLIATVKPQWNSQWVKLATRPTDPTVIIQPATAQIAKQHFVHTPSTQRSVDDPVLNSASKLTPQFYQRATTDQWIAKYWSEPLPTPTVQPRQTATPRMPRWTVATPPSSTANPNHTPPDLSQNAPPIYPALAIQRGWQGTVLLRFSINEVGSVTKVEVARSSGYPILDAAAVNAVRRWHAKPARHDGEPVATVEVLPVQFKL